MFKALIYLISNAVAIFAAEYFVPGFEATNDWAGFAVVVLLFTAANSLVLPVLRFILKPLIWLTLGLFSLVINGALIYVVDILSEGITISGLLPLLLATIIIGLINAIFSWLSSR